MCIRDRSNAVSAYIERITGDRSVTPCFNTFYEFVRDDYRRQLEKKHVRDKDFDIDNFLNVLEPYYLSLIHILPPAG